MINFFMKWLVPKLEDWCIKNDRVLFISGTEDPQNVYLRRYFLFRSPVFSVYIHRFMRSDKDDHHDHPFDFVSYVVIKGYTESTMYGGKWTNLIVAPQFAVKKRKPGTWAFRRAEAIHMIELDKTYNQMEYKEAPLTVIVRGPYRREWGFWPKDQWGGYRWMLWSRYLGVPESDVRE